MALALELGAPRPGRRAGGELDSYRFPTYADNGNPADDHKLIQATCVGIVTDVASCGFPIDIELGLGVAF